MKNFVAMFSPEVEGATYSRITTVDPICLQFFGCCFILFLHLVIDFRNGNIPATARDVFIVVFILLS